MKKTLYMSSETLRKWMFYLSVLVKPIAMSEFFANAIDSAIEKYTNATTTIHSITSKIRAIHYEIDDRTPGVTKRSIKIHLSEEFNKLDTSFRVYEYSPDYRVFKSVQVGDFIELGFDRWRTWTIPVDDMFEMKGVTLIDYTIRDIWKAPRVVIHDSIPQEMLDADSKKHA